jgi:hypothetical protein
MKVTTRLRVGRFFPEQRRKEDFGAGCCITITPPRKIPRFAQIFRPALKGRVGCVCSAIAFPWSHENLLFTRASRPRAHARIRDGAHGARRGNPRAGRTRAGRDRSAEARAHPRAPRIRQRAVVAHPRCGFRGVPHDRPCTVDGTLPRARRHRCLSVGLAGAGLARTPARRHRSATWNLCLRHGDITPAAMCSAATAI